MGKALFFLLTIFSALAYATFLQDIPLAARPKPAFDHTRLKARPEGGPPSFDCAARILSYQYALKIQPWRAPLQEVWDAFQLGTLCNQTFQDVAPTMLKPNPIPEDTKIFYVSTNGSDSNSGTFESPLLTIQAGINRVRLTNGPGAVVIREGTYYLQETIFLSPEDSGLTISNYANEEVYISGGQPLRNLEWTPYNVSSEPVWEIFENQNNVYLRNTPLGDTLGVRFLGNFSTAEACQNACAAQTAPMCTSYTFFLPSFLASPNQCYATIDSVWGPLPEGNATSGRIVQMNVYVADLSSYNISSIPGLQLTNGGKRAFKARYPSADTELAQFPAGWILSSETYVPAKQYPAAQTILIESPSRSYQVEFQDYSIGVGGPCSIFTPPESYWCSANNSGGGAGVFETPQGVQYFNDTFTNSNPYYWKNPSEAIVHMWHPYHWASWMYKLDSVDNNNTLHWTYGGFQGARGSISAEGRGGEWYVENVFEELDTPNEYYYDEKTQQLYYFFNGTSPNNSMDFDAASLKVLISVQGNQEMPVRDITIQGLAFVNTAQTGLDPHGVPSGGDWAMQRTAALEFEGVEGITIDQCLFQRLDGNALLISGYSRNFTVSNSEFVWIGDSAMVAWGYSQDMDGTDGNQPRYTTIKNNFVHELGHFEKQSSPWFQAISCQTLLEGNIFFNGPRALVNFNDGFGGGNEIVGNLMFNPNRETSDQGPFNSWDRMPFLTDVRDGTPSLIPAWNDIHNNMFFCNYGSNMCVDNDDGSSYYLIHDNFEVYGGHKCDFGGHSKYTYNTIIAYCQDYSQGLCGNFIVSVPGYQDGFWNNTMIQGANQSYVQIDPCVLPTPNFAELPTMYENTIYNQMGTVNITCSNGQITLKNYQALGLEPGTKVIGRIPSDEEIIEMGKEKIGM